MTSRTGKPADLPIMVPIEGSALSRVLDERRRAGLADPDWSLTEDGREASERLLRVVQEALEDSNLGKPSGTPGLTEIRLSDQLRAAGIKPGNRKELEERRDQLIRRLTGTPPPLRLVHGLSTRDPRSGLDSRQRTVVAGVLVPLSGVAAGILATWLGTGFGRGLLVALVVSICVLVLVVMSTRSVSSDPLRVDESMLDSRSPRRAQVHVITPASPSHATAQRLIKEVRSILYSPSWLRGHDSGDAAELLADRDRILAELHDLDLRKGSLDSVAADVHPANAGDLDRLSSEVDQRRHDISGQIARIADLAGKVRSSDAAVAAESRQERARHDLDGLASPPPRAIGPDLDRGPEL